jgi:hypothetical protein
MRTTTVQLPNGFVSSTGENIRDIEIRKLTGEEEDMVLDKEELRRGGILDRLLVRCIVRAGTITDPKVISAEYFQNFLLADCQFLLVELRKWSIDEIYRFDHTCPRCEAIGNKAIDLTTLAVNQQKDSYRFAREYVETVENDDGDTVPFEFRHLFVRDNTLLENIKVDFKKEKGTRELILQLKKYNGAAVHPQLLKKMTWGERTRIRNIIDAHTGGLDNVLLFTCRNCDKSYKDHMPIEVRSFFFPAGDTPESVETAIPYRSSGSTRRSLPPDGDGSPVKSEDSPSTNESSTSDS